MSRSMLREASGNKAINTGWSGSPVPAGHKWEVTDVWLYCGGTTGRYAAIAVLTAGAVFNLLNIPVTPVAGYVATLTSSGGVVLLPGDVMTFACYGGGASAWNVMYTYVDVDYSV